MVEHIRRNFLRASTVLAAPLPALKLFDPAQLRGRFARSVSLRPAGRRWTRPERYLLLFGLVMLLIGGITWEFQTSTLQSLAIRALVSSFQWEVVPGPSGRVIFPRWGPFDERMGYTRIPEFRHRLEKQGYRIARQAQISKSLETWAKLGVTPPQGDRSNAGLVIRARDGSVLFEAAASRHHFKRFEDIPPAVVTALALMEDHGIDPEGPSRSNPAVDWGRLSRAAVFSVGSKLGLPVAFQGGSTIAVQIEKYRHSRDGRTRSAMDKFQQIVSASLRVYGPGSKKRDEQRTLVLDYLNTVPLGGAPGYGEVHGVGEGVRAWFGLDPDHTFRALADTTGDDPDRPGALKHVLALLCAVRAPSRMLRADHADLERRLAYYQQRLVDEGRLDPGLARRMDAVPLHFVKSADLPPVPESQREVVEHVRSKLPRLLGLKDLHELDGLDLEVETSYDAELQRKALGLLRTLQNPDSVEAFGLKGKHMLETGDPSRVWYSLLLCERTPDGDLVSVVADDLDGPFDLNTGMRLQLGSTAKLRTTAHYLEIVERLYHDLSPLGAKSAGERAAQARDPITRWAALELARDPEMPVDTLLRRALDREYSASPGEAFFTGGGIHTFGNFDKDDNGRHPALREAFAHSTNLVFVRLMRDLVRWHVARLPYDAQEVLGDSTSALRTKMLKEAADEEARAVLRRTWKALASAPADSIPESLLGTDRTPRRMAMLFYAWHHGAPTEALQSWLAARGMPGDSAYAAELARAYGNPALTLRDYAYLLDLHPLQIWTGGELKDHGALSWKDLLARSGKARDEAQQWLFEPRNRRAQDLRLRVLIERDAFARMAEDWKRLGFPFERLVPSYATALGSSADRPAALARLMGIIMNDGVLREPRTIRKIRFAPGTPYETVLEPAAQAGDRRMSAPVAHTLRELLALVVERGTAQRLATVFPDSLRDLIKMGGKTGSGDNRFETYGHGGRVLTSRAVNRTATFVFYVGDRYYGVMTAVVDGPTAGGYTFTSALPVQIVRMLAPELEQRIAADLPPRPAPAVTNHAPAPATAASVPSPTPDGLTAPKRTAAPIRAAAPVPKAPRQAVPKKKVEPKPFEGVEAGLVTPPAARYVAAGTSTALRVTTAIRPGEDSH